MAKKKTIRPARLQEALVLHKYILHLLGCKDLEALSQVLKTDDIHPPKSVISVHFFCLICLMALQI